jgi:hypothetical protein
MRDRLPLRGQRRAGRQRYDGGQLDGLDGRDSTLHEHARCRSVAGLRLRDQRRDDLWHGLGDDLA